MEKVQIPNSQFFALAKQLLQEGKKIEISVKGNSMFPFLRDGETVVVAPVGISGSLKRHDIILAETTTGHIMMHRIREVNPAYILMKGDGNLLQTEQLNHSDVMGKAISVRRNGKNIPLYSPLQLFLTRLWSPLLVRKVGLRLFRIFSKP